uniref:Uncharacterized protein n=1 Tax=Arundo donax TaxID=35708 RepID=A0A0A9E2K3_ARUDO
MRHTDDRLHHHAMCHADGHLHHLAAGCRPSLSSSLHGTPIPRQRITGAVPLEYEPPLVPVEKKPRAGERLVIAPCCRRRPQVEAAAAAPRVVIVAPRVKSGHVPGVNTATIHRVPVRQQPIVMSLL